MIQFILGEIRTHRIVITMGPQATLTNTTTGHSVSMGIPISGGFSSSNVTIDVEQMTATQDGMDVSSYMTWTRRFPMRLVPGNNDFTGDFAHICYRAAYL